MRASEVLNESARSYYNGTGLHQSDSEFLEKLVPSSGPSKFLIGEISRAASRIYHDYFNNGFGNNWTGAFNFLDEYTKLDPSVRQFLEYYAGGRVVPDGANPNLDVLIEKMVDDAVVFAMNVENPRAPRPADMFDLQGPASQFCQECGDEMDDRDSDALCSDCRTCGTCGGDTVYGCECDEEEEDYEEDEDGDEW